MATDNLEKLVNSSEKNSGKIKTYSFDEAVKASTEYFKGDELAATVFVNKYALKDSAGNIYEKTPEDMHWRIANEIERIEKKNNYPNPLPAEKVYGLLKDFKYIVPQGSPMSGIGNNYQKVSLSNCFVIGNESDSYGGIMTIDQEQVQLMKRRGGVGHDLSHIRPSASPVDNSALTSTGVVPFMERFSNSTREVAQDGRRGALMLSISVKHPDAESFIDAKMTQGKVTGANVSVRIDDEFMEAVRDGKNYIQQYPVDSPNPIVKKEIDARGLWKKIIHNAWKSAEPGVLFWDTIIRESVPDSYIDKGFKTVSTNPCGEIPLCPYDSCRLLAMNLYSYVDKPFTKDAKFNYDLFREHSGYAQRIMDDIIDLELEKIDVIKNKIKGDPEAEKIKRVEYELWENIETKAKQGRRTGIGITGEGDMLASLGFRYGSDEGNNFSTEIHKNFALEIYRSSVKSAKERGKFEIFDFEKEKDNPFMNRLYKEDPKLKEDMEKYGRRNISLLTIAPTGTTSLMTQTTSGLEPVFLPVYKRRRKVNPNDKNVKVAFVDEVGDSWEEYNVFHHKFVDWMTTNGINPAQKFSDEEVDKLVEKSPYYKATSNDVDWLSKVKLQGAVQKYVDHSISVTINLPENASEDLVDELYRTAWKEECKGVTVYRDGSRSGVLLSNKDKKKEGGLEKIFPDKRPTELEADVLRFKNDNGNGGEDWIAFIGKISGKPYEIFTGKTDDEILAVPKSIKTGKIVKVIESDGTKHYDFEYADRYGYKNIIGGLSHQFDREFWNYSKIISGVLRKEMPIVDVVDLIQGLNLDNDTINSWKSGVQRALKKYIQSGTASKELCPDCLKKGVENKLVFQEGCMGCSCGFSKCG